MRLSENRRLWGASFGAQLRKGCGGAVGRTAAACLRAISLLTQISRPRAMNGFNFPRIVEG